jgi:hypothetical protein
MKKLIFITDQYSKIWGYRFLNSQLSFYIGICQLLVCLWALLQHIYSIINYNKVLYCNFENVTLTDEPQLLVGVDAIIFDVGLFHSLWGIHGCVAQHLDGGYGRFGWCISHIFSLTFCLPFAFCSHPKPIYLWPLLIQQSIYGIGLLILSLAALPRVLPSFMGDIGSAPTGAIFIYVFGATMNYLLLYWYWHWYWFIEAEYESATKLRHNRLSDDVHIDPRRRPFHYPAEELDGRSNGFIPQSQRFLVETTSSSPGTAAATSATIQMIANGINKFPKSTTPPTLPTTKQVPYPTSSRSHQSQHQQIQQPVHQELQQPIHQQLHQPSFDQTNGHVNNRRAPPPMYNNGYAASDSGYYGPAMIQSPMSQQSRQESFSSNFSNFPKIQLPHQHRHQKPPIYDQIPSDLISPQYQSDDNYYPSDDSATAPILSHFPSHQKEKTGSQNISNKKFRPIQHQQHQYALKQSSSATSSITGGMGYATMAQARYAKFNSQPVTFRKSSITPGGAPFAGNRIKQQQQQSQQHCSLSSPSTKPHSRLGTPVISPMYSTAI